MSNKRMKKRKYVYFCIVNLIFIFLFNCGPIKEIRTQGEARKFLIQGQKVLAQRDYEGSLAENEKALALSNRQPPGDEALFNMGLIYAHFANPGRDYGKSLNCFVQILNDYPRSPLIEEVKIWVGVLHENEKLTQAWVGVLHENEKLTQTIEKFKQTIQDTRVRIEQLEKSNKLDTVTVDRSEPRAHLLQGQKLLAQRNYEGSLAENEKALALSNRQPPGDEALFNMGLIYADFVNPSKDFGKSVGCFKRMMEYYPKSPLFEQAKLWVGILQDWVETLRENDRLNRIIKRSLEVDIEIEEKKKEKSK